MTAMGMYSVNMMSHQASAGSMDASVSHAHCTCARTVSYTIIMILDAIILASIFVVISLAILGSLVISLVLAILVLLVFHPITPKR